MRQCEGCGAYVENGKCEYCGSWLKVNSRHGLVIEQYPSRKLLPVKISNDCGLQYLTVPVPKEDRQVNYITLREFMGNEWVPHYVLRAGVDNEGRVLVSLLFL